MRHYLMTTDEHFEAAVKGDGPAAKVMDDYAIEMASEKAAQNAAQRAHAAIRGESHETKQAPDESRACVVLPDLFGVSEQTFSGEDRIRTCGRV